MLAWEGKRPIPIVTACMNAKGSPDFALNQVEVTQEEAANGIHFYFAEAELLKAGYEEPFVHFDFEEAPAFLHPAVRQYLGLPSESADPFTTVASEETRCPA